MKIALKHLTDAVCRNDEKSKGDGVDKTFDAIGVDYESAHYVAEQRALRAILLINRKQSVPDKLTPVYLTNEEQDLLDKYTIMFMDGLAAGVTAALTSIKEYN